MELPTQVWTMGWRVPRAAHGLGVEVVVWHTVPPLDGLMCCVRCPHHGGPRLCCGVERADRALVRWCRLLCARSPCCAGSVPGRRRSAHICAQSLSMLWVCGMEQGWAILQVEHPPDEASWRNPNVYYDACGPPSPSRTRAGSCYGSDRLHCLSPNETHIPVSLHEQHNNAVGFMPSGFPKRMVGHGWVPMTTEIRAVWSQVVPKLVKGEMRVYADATWGW